MPLANPCCRLEEQKKREVEAQQQYQQYSSHKYGKDAKESPRDTSQNYSNYTSFMSRPYTSPNQHRGGGYHSYRGSSGPSHNYRHRSYNNNYGKQDYHSRKPYRK